MLKRYGVTFLSCLVLLCAGVVAAQSMADPAMPRDVIHVAEFTGFPTVIPHERKARTECLNCHSDYRERAPNHPTGLTDQCLQCHVYHWQLD